MTNEFKVAIITYSLYGHTAKLAQHIKIGLDKIPGCKSTIFQVPETLPQEILLKVKAPPKQDFPVIKLEDLPGFDAFFFGIPTRYGMAPSQLKAFWDSTGGLWVS
jgi:NAD(P)H dehydrogenase (quinone)